MNEAVGESNAIVRELDDDVPKRENIPNVDGIADENIYLKIMLAIITLGALRIRILQMIILPQISG